MGSEIANVLAVKTLDMDLVKAIISKECDVNKRDINGNTPLHLLFSVYRQRPSSGEYIMTLLLDVGAMPNIENNLGVCPIHIAARQDSAKALLAIIQANSKLQAERRDTFDINIRCGSDLMSPLHLAAYSGCFDSVRLLLNHGADALALCANGRTPRMYARVYLLVAKLLFREERQAFIRLNKDFVKESPQPQSICHNYSTVLGLSAAAPEQGLQTHMAVSISSLGCRRPTFRPGLHSPPFTVQPSPRSTCLTMRAAPRLFTTKASRRTRDVQQVNSLKQVLKDNGEPQYKRFRALYTLLKVTHGEEGFLETICELLGSFNNILLGALQSQLISCTRLISRSGLQSFLARLQRRQRMTPAVAHELQHAIAHNAVISTVAARKPAPDYRSRLSTTTS